MSNLIAALNRMAHLYHRAKSETYYRVQFGSFGTGSVLRKPLLLANTDCIHIGREVYIREGARLEVVKGTSVRNPRLEIGSGTNIEQNVHIVCHNFVRLGENVSITGNCCIVDVTHPYDDVTDASKIGSRILDDAASVEIGDNSFLGFGTVVLPNVRIGKYVITGANSVVVDNVPDYSVVAGAPAKVIRTYDFEAGRWVSNGSGLTNANTD